jgi:hypothetical protein
MILRSTTLSSSEGDPTSVRRPNLWYAGVIGRRRPWYSTPVPVPGTVKGTPKLFGYYLSAIKTSLLPPHLRP